MEILQRIDMQSSQFPQIKTSHASSPHFQRTDHDTLLNFYLPYVIIIKLDSMTFPLFTSITEGVEPVSNLPTRYSVIEIF